VASDELFIVKLGGSVLTRKREAERVRPKILARLATEIGAHRPARLVLLHGAGSFGHPGAHRFHLAQEPLLGDAARRERLRGSAVVAAEVRRLHLLVLRALVAAGVPAWSTPAGSLARNAEGHLESLDPAPFERALAQGCVPVSFGDVVLDTRWGFSILSADTIARELGSRLGASRVIFVSDVPGVVQNFGRGRPKIVEDLEGDETDRASGAATARDVTGGLRTKVETMRALAGAGVEAALISGLSDGLLGRALRGEHVYGSWAGRRPG
jgi:isopentenyl phosphate kinase